MKNLALTVLALFALAASPSFAAGKKKTSKDAPAAASPAPPQRTLTNYFCTIWNEVTFDSAAAPVLKQASNLPVPHMGNVAIYQETGTKIPRPRDMWKEDSLEHAQDHPDKGMFPKAPDTVVALDTSNGYVLHWVNAGEGGDIQYEFLTIREDHQGPRKPFFAGMGGNLYIGICDPPYPE
jgi:hypothetical protein